MAKRPYLDRDEYAWTYYEAQKQARLFFLPFNEYERLADNDVREDLPQNMPRINDGSLADLLQKTVMRVLAQMYTGTAKITESIDPQTGKPTNPQPWLQELTNFVWTKHIVPNANTQAPYFRKAQLALYRALIYGSCPIYTFFTSNGSYRGADMAIPYIRDVYLEVGKSSDLDSDYIFMDTYYTRLQLARIIAQGNRLQDVGVKSPWDLEALKKIYDSHVESQKDYLSKNKAERNRPVRATQIRFTTVFQRGVQAPFDTFYVGAGVAGGYEDATIVRSKINEDPTGDVPIHFLYAYEDLVNPYGKGQIKLSGGTQNALDYLTQLHILATQLGLQPPVLIEGDTQSTDVKSMIYAPNQYWFTGGAKVDIMETVSSVYKEFPTAYGMYKGNLVNAQGQAPVDVSGESGNPIAGKTPKAITQRQATTSEYDNYMRGQFYNTFRRVTKSMINIHFANMQGEDLEKLAADDAIKLTRAGLIPSDEQGQPQSQQIVLEWNNLRGKFDFEIDPDSVVVKDNQEQITALSAVLEYVTENPYMLQYINSTGYSLNLGELYRAILTKLGLQDMEKILEPMSDQDKAKANAVPPMVFDKPKIGVDYDELPPTAQLQMLQRLGYNVTMLDILMGPVLDPNRRGVYNPQDQPPGTAMNPIGPQAGTLEQENGGQPVPPTPSSLTPAAPATPGAPAAPTAAQPVGPQPQSIGLLKQTMAEHGLQDPRQAMAVMHAKALGIPDEDIANYMQKNGVGKYAGQQPAALPAGRKARRPLNG
jgi:hypothetical protein